MAEFSPNYFLYHQSLSKELQATKDRIRNLVDHDLTDGAFKEAALRSVLRRHLPENRLIGRGFVVTKRASSTECDVLIVDASKPTLFKDGDLVIVTPDAVRAIISVKTELQEGEVKISEALRHLADQKTLCAGSPPENSRVWAGLFCYSAKTGQETNLLNSLGAVYQETQVTIDCVSFGPDWFARFHPKRLPKQIRKLKESGAEMCEKLWALSEVPGLSPTYLLGDVLINTANVGRESGRGIWSPRFRKHNKLRFYLPLGETASKPLD